MFEFLFQHSPAAYSKGQFVLLGSWPIWVLGLLIVAAAGVLGYLMWRRQSRHAVLSRRRQAVLWGLQSMLVALLLFLLWRPALSIPSLQPQQNAIAVLIDDSQSMAVKEDGQTRLEKALRALEGGVLERLQDKFQVRLYRVGSEAGRIESLKELTGTSGASRISGALQRVVADATSVPIGAVVLLTDGAESTGGIGLETITGLRRQKIPVHTVGFGREKLANDLELVDVSAPVRTLADSRLHTQVTFRQQGFKGQKVRMVVKEGGRVLASEEAQIKADGQPQTESIFFNAGAAGAKNLEVSVGPLSGEENTRNNVLMRLVNVEAATPRVLYVEGEPRWEFKFIRRAIEEDRSLHLTTLLRTTQNKIYRQGISDPKEMEDGFPDTEEALFPYKAIIIGSVEAGYFTPKQQDLIRRFVDRRGGGVLFLAGRNALADGGWAGTPLAEILPVSLPNKRGTFRREEAAVQLTVAGRDSLITRIEETPDANVDRWKKLPVLADYQEVGTPKPAALVFAEVIPPNQRPLPLLAAQSYGRGRTAVMATSGSWRWQMLQSVEDTSHEMFWQQMLRWLVAEAPGQVSSSTPKPVLSDDTLVPLRAEVRNKEFEPMSDAQVEARIVGPDGIAASIEMLPKQDEAGVYTADWTAEPTGSYIAEIVVRRGEEEIGRDALMFRREDGTAEHFRTEQHRELLVKLSQETGGQYYEPGNLSRLPDDISYSEAGITVRDHRDLWSLPIVFFAILGMVALEWILRRKWGVI